MKFWKELIEKLSDIVYLIREMRTDLLIELRSIDEKLTKAQFYYANEGSIISINNIPIMLLEENSERCKVIIQNIGLEPCYIKLGNGVSKEDFHFVLAPDTASSFGNGGSVTLDNWHGEVYAICEKETTVSVLEY